MPLHGLSHDGRGTMLLPAAPVNARGVNVAKLADALHVHVCDTGCIHLSPLDVKILVQLVHGGSDDQIARAIDESARVVKEHLKQMYRLAGVQSRLQLAMLMVRKGVIA